MTVTDTDSDDAGEHVEVATALVVEQPLHVALVDEHGALVERQRARTQVLPADLTDSVVRQTLQDSEDNKPYKTTRTTSPIIQAL